MKKNQLLCLALAALLTLGAVGCKKQWTFWLYRAKIKRNSPFH